MKRTLKSLFMITALVGFLWSCSEDDAAPSITGDYKGTWNDNLYVNFPISVRMTTETSGIFYYTNNFTSCCGGSNDGTVTFTYDENDITFRYDQRLVDFMDGSCDGTYEGTGKVAISDKVLFTITFEGNDCEGAHTGGRIILSKQ